MLDHQPWVFQALIEIAFEAARDPPLQCDCFGLLMRQGHSEGGRSSRTSGWSSAITGCACLF